MNEEKWRVIKNNYITTGATLKQLSESEGVSISTLKRKSASEHWVNEKYAEKFKNACVVPENDKISKTCARLHEIINISISRILAEDEPDAAKVQKLAATLKILKEIAGDEKENGSKKEQDELIRIIKEAVTEGEI